MRKGTVKLDWVPTVELHKQNGLNCTGCGPLAAGRATWGFMVRQRSMRRKPLYLTCNSRWLNGAGSICGPSWSDLRFRTGEHESACPTRPFLRRSSF